VVETVTLTQKTIPFNTRTELSADLEIDQQALLQGGEPGLAIARLRTRSEDGLQVSQQSENEVVVRAPQDRILGFGTKIVIRTTTVDGVIIEYWRALTLKATSYSPCRSATPDGRCMYGTSSGLPVQRGVVAMVYSWYILFGFEHIYIPGYGKAVVGDVGSGLPGGDHYWVDMGWTDEEYQPLEYPNGVTVYFLTPVPANPGYILP
jgi:3D (Asp-Asp-Asp) domain-containing protein